MPLETGTTINDLVTTNPAASDSAGGGDDHLRLLKTVLKASFPDMGGAAWRDLPKSGTYTATPADNFSILTHAATGPLTLPAASSITTGFMLLLNPATAAVNTIVCPAGATETINGVTGTATVQGGSFAFLVKSGAATWNLLRAPRLTGEGMYIPGALTVSSSVVIGGNLTVGGPTTLSGNVQITTNLYVAGTATISGASTFGGKITAASGVDGAASTFASATVLGAATISGQATFNTGIYNTGPSTLSGTVVVGQNLYVAGSGGITVSAGVLCANIEIVGSAIGGLSYIDFKNNLAEDNDVRIQLLGNDALDFAGLSTFGLTKDSSALYCMANILGTVSQSGGTPTGAIIEKGTNANGTYVRFADGTQLCWHSFSWADINTASGNVFTSAGSMSWTFPAAFSTLGFTSGTPGNFGGTWGGQDTVTTATTGVFRAFASGSYTGAFTMTVFAMGVWF